MDAHDWLVDHFRKMPHGGILSIDNHEQEEELREAIKHIIIYYNEIFREEGFEMELSNDYKYAKKILYPF